MLAENQILQGRYRIIRLLGEGGMGAVYEAKDEQLFGKSVALKEILLNLTNKNLGHFRRAFEREAKILTQIDHDAVPKVVDYFHETNRQFLVMELIKGNDLDKSLEKRQKPFPLKEVLGWADQLLDALDYLHTLKKPIIHRDIKPQNIKLNAKGKIKLLDFGIAKDTNAEINSTKATRKTFVGATLYYSPIEQIIRIPDYFEMLDSVYSEKAEEILSQSADARSDIYSLGATLYHLLTNNFPKPAHIRAFEVWAGKTESLKPSHIVNPKIPVEISEILTKAMEIERENRFGSAQAMQTALRELNSYETKRKEDEEKVNWRAEHAEIKRDRQALEAERRELEAEHKKQDQLEYETKLKKWQNENLPNEVSDEKSYVAATLPFATQSFVENSDVEAAADLIESEENDAFMEMTAVSYLEGVDLAPEEPQNASDTKESVHFENAPDTVENVHLLTSSDVLPPQKRPLWIFPTAIVALLIFGIVAVGMLMLFNSSKNKSVSNTQTSLPTAPPTISPTPEPSVEQIVSATPEPTVEPTPEPTAVPTPLPTNSPAPVVVSETAKPRPTPMPTVNKTPVQVVPVKTPQPQIKRTPKPQPTKNSDCIFTGDC